jgi:hypothetical protein
MALPATNGALAVTATRSLTRSASAELTGPWLALAQAGWIAVALFQVALSAIGLPPYFARLSSLCAGQSCPLWQLTPSAARALAQSGIPLGAYAAYSMLLQGIMTLMFWIVAALIFWRASRQRVALLASLALLMVGTLSPSAREALSLVSRGWYLASDFSATVGWATFFALFFSLFPDGRFAPRWAWIVAAGWYVVNVPGLIQDFDPRSPLLIEHWPLPLAIAMLGGLVVASIYAQVYRYRRVSTPFQRQQTKWVVFALATSTIIGAVPNFIGSIALSLAFPAYPADQYTVAGTTVTVLGFIVVPIALAVAMLRHQLWDIDRLINRTLVYGSLTALLAALYFASVIGMQQLVRLVSGAQAGNNPLAIVLSTLLIAALFQPLRRRLQTTIDRRFFRAKYDAARTLEAFAASLRGEVDLSDLSSHLVGVVEQTMRPAHVSLWLQAQPLATSAGRPVERGT